MSTLNEFSFPGLFRNVNNRQASILAYECNFFPLKLLGQKHKVAWQRTRLMLKREILAQLVGTELTLEDSPASFPVFWEYNAIPTETEWDKFTDDSIFRVEYRISPLIPNGGRAAVLSPHRLTFYMTVN